MTNETDPIPNPLSDEAKPAIEASAEAADTGVAAAADAATSAGNKAAEMATDAATQGADAYAQASTETAKAFEQARGRLQQMGVPGLDVGQAMLDQFKSTADGMSQRFAGGYGRTAQAMAEFNAKAVEAWRSNAEAAMKHWQSLVGVTSWSEMIALNTAHARKQMEAMTAQTRELAEIAGRIARDASDSAKPSN